MELFTQTVELPGSMTGYLARPARVVEPLPGVIVVQEIWGVDAHMRDVSQRFATAGYVALAPDLFSKGGKPEALSEPRVEGAKQFMEGLPPQAWGSLMDPTQRALELAKLGEVERRQLGETLAAFFGPDRQAQMATYAQDLVPIARWLREQGACRGRRLGAIGFCMGGGLAASLAALDPELRGAAVYYGQPPNAEQVAKLSCPLLGIYGQEDPRLVQQLPGFEQAMKAAGKPYELHVYPGTPHAFFNDSRRSYRAEAARDAWARTLAFFARELTPA
ncbi:MAG: dienelactone hydrolase family protein [Myxococcales bacterium]